MLTWFRGKWLFSTSDFFIPPPPEISKVGVIPEE